MRRMVAMMVALVASIAHAGPVKLATEHYLDTTEVSDAHVSPDGKRNHHGDEEL